MLSQAQNTLITQTGAATPMGALYREYWIPALLAEELPEPAGAPVRVKLLGERLIAFRDSNGKLGLIDEFCPHRGASLWFGRNEEGGLRCPYHGWKFDVEGHCTEVPSEPDASGFCDSIKLANYPLIQVGPVLWTHMGDPARRPAEPAWEFATVPAEQSFVSKRYQECNWLQAMEGGIDSSHVSFLHRGNLNTDPLFRNAAGNKYNLGDSKPVFEVVENDGGLYIGARRNAENGNYYWRITPWIMPCFTMVPPRGDHPMHGHFWIPIDDETCWAWSYDYHPVRALTSEERSAMEAGMGVHVEYQPGTNYRPAANKDNDYQMDRAAQKRGDTYSGIKGIAMQDASIQESMGPVVDRTRENLVSTDNGIIMARRRLLKAAKALAEQGVTPPGVDPEHHKVRSCAIVLAPDQAFKDVAKEDLRVRPGQKQTSV